MDLQKYLDSIPDKLAQSAHVKTVFGDAVTAQGKTIIPVARVRYGFGGGMGAGPTGSGEVQRLGQGGGGGGGVVANPVGVIEITPERTTFVPVHSRKRAAAVLFAGFVVGFLFSRR